MKFLVNSHVYVTAMVEANDAAEAEKIATKTLEKFANDATANNKGLAVEKPSFVSAHKIPAGTDTIN